ncbi:hypothetical protein [uncultured Amphritea sp.]|uniref:hypothetical protein n=1 Tax=uncultured Amphritea sp. TaxID=981605 RepID=UPI0026126F35|nr:hypothetical protein [uncultured Amphritea sp.]
MSKYTAALSNLTLEEAEDLGQAIQDAKVYVETRIMDHLMSLMHLKNGEANKAEEYVKGDLETVSHMKRYYEERREAYDRIGKKLKFKECANDLWTATFEDLSLQDTEFASEILKDALFVNMRRFAEVSSSASKKKKREVCGTVYNTFTLTHVEAIRESYDQSLEVINKLMGKLKFAEEPAPEFGSDNRI